MCYCRAARLFTDLRTSDRRTRCDQPPDRTAEQATLEIGGEMKNRSGIVVGDGHRHRKPNPASAAALQFNGFRLVVAGDSPMNDVAETLDLDA